MDYLHFSDIHEGDLIYEEGPATSVEVEVLNEPVQKDEQWTFNGRTGFGHVVRYLMTDGYMHYAPQLSRKPTRLVIVRLQQDEAISAQT